MNTRMEDVAVDVALIALRSVCTASEPPLDPEPSKRPSEPDGRPRAATGP